MGWQEILNNATLWLCAADLPWDTMDLLDGWRLNDLDGMLNDLDGGSTIWMAAQRVGWQAAQRFGWLLARFFGCYGFDGCAEFWKAWSVLGLEVYTV